MFLHIYFPKDTSASSFEKSVEWALSNLERICKLLTSDGNAMFVALALVGLLFVETIHDSSIRAIARVEKNIGSLREEFLTGAHESLLFAKKMARARVVAR